MTLLACSACFGQTVTIVNSGSTNFPGYKIVVDGSGKAEYTLRPRRFPIEKGQPKVETTAKTLPQDLTRSFFADLNAAQPLSGLPARHCAKSVSFGTKLTLQYGDETSPDLSCGDGGNEKLHALIRDTDAIVKIFRGE